MADNPNHPQAGQPHSLRLAGSGPSDALASARPAPVPVSVLQVEDQATPTDAAAESIQPQIIPFQVRAAMVAGRNQPAIRTRLVAARVPGVVLFRVP